MTVAPGPVPKIVRDEFDDIEADPSPQISVTRPEGTDSYEAYTVPVNPPPNAVVNGQPVTLAGDDTERRTMTIINTTANRNVVVGHRSQVSLGQGFILVPNVPLTLTTVREVVANAPFGVSDTDVRYVSVLVERNRV